MLGFREQVAFQIIIYGIFVFISVFTGNKPIYLSGCQLMALQEAVNPSGYFLCGMCADKSGYTD